MRILYVEDDLRDAELTRRELARRAPELELDTVGTLGDARARLAGGTAYDVVLSDLNLPDGSGLELVVEIRNLALPAAVVVLTGVEASETAVAALRAGADDYLIKRRDYLAGLPATLEGALERFRAEAGRRAHPLKVLYAHDGVADPDLTQSHVAARAPHIRLALVHGIPAALGVLSAAAAEPCPYDAVVLEHRAGTLDALDALKSLQSDGRRGLPVVLVAAQGDGEIAAQAFRFGAADYVVAERNHLDVLADVLEGACGRAELAREQAALRESELRYRTLFEQAAVGVAHVDPATDRIVHANRRYAEMLGYSREELEQLDVSKVTHPDDRAADAANGALLDAGELSEYTTEKRYIRKDGGTVWVSLSVSRTETVPGAPGRRIAVVVDVSDRKRAEAEAESQQRIVRSIAETLPGMLYVYDVEGRRNTYMNPGLVELLERPAEQAKALADELFMSILHPDDLARVPRRATEIASARDGEVLEAEYRIEVGPERWKWLHAWNTILSREADGSPKEILGLAMDITSRKQAEESLRESEERFRGVFDLSPISLVLTRLPDGELVEVNHAFTKETGYDRDDVVGRRSMELDFWVDAAERDRCFDRVMREDGIDDVEVVFRRKDGSTFHALFSSHKVTIDGLPFSLATAIDISDRKRVEEALRSSEERFRGVFDLSPIAILMASLPGGAIVEANHAFTRDFGHEREETLGRTSPELGLWTDPAERERYFELMARDGRVDSLEATLRKKDGSEFRALVSGSGITIDGAPFSIVSGIDISERKRAEDELRLAARRLSLATEAAQIGIFDADLVTGGLARDARMFEMYGVDAGAFVLDREAWAERIHPDDRPGTTAALEAAVAGDGAFDHRYRVLTGDGDIRTIEARATVLRAPDGTPLRLIGTNRDITEKMLAEQQVREVRDHLAATLEAIPDLLFEIDSSGRFVDYRAPHEELLVVPPEQFLGKSIDEVLPPAVARVVGEAIREAAERRHSFGREYELTVPGGDRSFELSVARMAEDAAGEPSFIVLARDVTDRKAAESAVRESEARLSSIVDNALDGIVTVDEEQRILVYNAAAEAMFGWPAAEMIGQPLERLLPRGSVASHRESLERYAESGVAARQMGEAGRVSGLRANGEEFPVEASISQTQVGAQRLFTVIARDVTEREHAAELRGRLETQLGEARRMEAIGTLASGIAHDFNNILSAVLGNTELALHEIGAEHPIARSLEETRRASRRGADLVRQILTFGRQGREVQRVTSLRSVVEEAVRLGRANLSAQVELDAAFGADVPNVLANATQIHQIVMNLCANANHAIGEQPGRIDVRLDSILLEADAHRVHPDLTPGRYAHLSVSDTGEGMDAVTRERVFEPFFTTRSIGQGTGLGLSVVHGIVKAHRAAITVTSRPGEGTTFDLYLPATEAPAETGADAGPAPDLEAGGGARVLYVDDEPSLVSIGTLLLDRLGCVVSGYTSPTEALEAVRADPLAFDLVMTDFNMPRLSGLDLARELSQLRPELPVVLMSGYVTDELQAKAALYGVRRILHKPSPHEDFAGAVRLLARPKPQK